MVFEKKNSAAALMMAISQQKRWNNDEAK